MKHFDNSYCPFVADGKEVKLWRTHGSLSNAEGWLLQFYLRRIFFFGWAPPPRTPVQPGRRGWFGEELKKSKPSNCMDWSCLSFFNVELNVEPVLSAWGVPVNDRLSGYTARTIFFLSSFFFWLLFSCFVHSFTPTTLSLIRQVNPVRPLSVVASLRFLGARRFRFKDDFGVQGPYDSNSKLSFLPSERAVSTSS